MNYCKTSAVQTNLSPRNVKKIAGSIAEKAIKAIENQKKSSTKPV